MTTWKFWKQTIERGVKTTAQTLGATLLAGPVAGLLEADWVAALSVSGMAGVLSVLTSIASAPVGDEDSPSLV
jgi:hypothetical protein